MQIFVQVVGNFQRTITIDVETDVDIDDFKIKIGKKIGADPMNFFLTHSGHLMETGKLSDHGIQRESTVLLFFRSMAAVRNLEDMFMSLSMN